MAYERMRNEVRQAMPNFLVPARVEIIPTTIKATEVQKRGALKALDSIEKLFGKGGKHWRQGEYHSLQDGFESFCLSGALNKADGRHEALARVVIGLAITQLYPAAMQEYNSQDVESHEREVASEGAQPAAAEGDGLITAFNDLEGTNWSDVKKVLRRARKLLAV